MSHEFTQNNSHEDMSREEQLAQALEGLEPFTPTDAAAYQADIEGIKASFYGPTLGAKTVEYAESLSRLLSNYAVEYVDVDGNGSEQGEPQISGEQLREMETLADIHGQSGASNGMAISLLKRNAPSEVRALLEQGYPSRAPEETKKAGSGVVGRLIQGFKSRRP